MSTHCMIAYKKDGKYVAAFCDQDGYLLGAGVALMKSFNSMSKAMKLVNDGSMSCAREGMSYLSKEHCCGKPDMSKIFELPAAERWDLIEAMPLGWTEEMFNAQFEESKPKAFSSLNELARHADSVYAKDSIYVYDCESKMWEMRSKSGKLVSLEYAIETEAKLEGLI